MVSHYSTPMHCTHTHKHKHACLCLTPSYTLIYIYSINSFKSCTEDLNVPATDSFDQNIRLCVRMCFSVEQYFAWVNNEANWTSMARECASCVLFFSISNRKTLANDTALKVCRVCSKRQPKAVQQQPTRCCRCCCCCSFSTHCLHCVFGEDGKGILWNKKFK